jgi:hypothetical protein
MENNLLDIYTDYLLSSFGPTTATGLSRLTDNDISHDKITRFLSSRDFTSKELWKIVKSSVRHIESNRGVIIFDDTICEKLYTDENEIITWHFDHSKNRTVKGLNLLNCLYFNNEVSIPVAFEIIKKEIIYCDLATRTKKRKSEINKNEHLRNMLRICFQNNLQFQFVLADNWYSSKDNMNFVKKKIGKEFIFGLKSNRTIALSPEDKANGNFVRVDSLDLEANTTYTAYIRGVDFPVLICKQVFKNKDKSKGILYLVSSDINMTYDQIKTTYQKRWKVETFHKSLKSNLALSKSPTKTKRTQSNHFFTCIVAFFKMEKLKIKFKLNHFAIKSKIYIKAIKVAFEQIQALRA